MTTRFHINPKTGNPGQCRAKIKDCPFGLAIEDHFQSKDAARLWYESQNSSFTPSKVTEEQANKAYFRAADLIQRYSFHNDPFHPEFKNDFADAQVAANDYMRMMTQYLKQENATTEEELDEIWEEQKGYNPDISREEVRNEVLQESERSFNYELEDARLRSIDVLEGLRKLNKALSDDEFITKIAKDKSLFTRSAYEKYHDNEKFVKDFIGRVKESLLKNTTTQSHNPFSLEDLTKGSWLGQRSYFRKYVKDEAKLLNALLNK